MSDHFTYKRILTYVFPTFVMMMTASIYSIVDGLFVTNLVGKVPFAAINLVMPMLFILGSVGYMAGAGGSAIVAFTLGEGNKEKASEYFSLIILFAAVAGLVLGIAGVVWIRPAAMLMGARDTVLEDSILYGRIILAALPCFILSNAFQSFFMTAEKPKMGLYMSFFSGILNVVLDAIFIAVFHWGLTGAALSTTISQFTGALIEFLYFVRDNDSLLRLRRPSKDFRIIVKTCVNGSSEMVNSIAASVVTVLYNYQLMHYSGADGVAAYGVIVYAGHLFTAFYYAYSSGCSPIISYQHGSKNTAELQNIFRMSLRVMGGTGIFMVILVRLIGRQVAGIFIGYDPGLLDLAVHAFYIYSLSFLFEGFDIFASSLFTALGNGKISALISFLKIFVFETSAILALPLILGLDGIWWATLAAQLASLALAVFFLIREEMCLLSDCLISITDRIKYTGLFIFHILRNLPNGMFVYS